MKRIINAIKQLKGQDLLAPLLFLLLFIPSLAFRAINRIKKRNLWLIAEQGEARDNGYHFYKYVRENHPADYCFYVAKPGLPGYEKVAKLGNIVRWGSFKHWLYYMSACLNISSQKSGNPCPIFWYFIHVTLGLYRNRVFLQHGITHNDSKWIYCSKTNFKYFVCGAKKEFDFVKEKFGYPDKSLLLTGFPRWDALKDISKTQKQKSILIMPTWRNWLGGEKNAIFKTKDFKKTSFFQNWNRLLSDKSFIKIIEQNNIKVYFYPHVNMQKFISSFVSNSENIEFVSTDSDIQDYFRKCNLMITDYSSVAFDFAYLNKPVIYYQFDQKEYRSRQYQEGFFIYERDGFGPVVKHQNEVIDAIRKMLDNKNTQHDLMRSNDFFFHHDNKNSQRLYSALRRKG